MKITLESVLRLAAAVGVVYVVVKIIEHKKPKATTPTVKLDDASVQHEETVQSATGNKYCGRKQSEFITKDGKHVVCQAGYDTPTILSIDK